MLTLWSRGASLQQLTLFALALALMPPRLSDAATRAEPTDTDEEPTSVDWGKISSYLSQVAAERAFDLPPLQEDLSFLRLAVVLAELCHQVYAARTAVEAVTVVHLPQAGHLSPRSSVVCRLLHFREASADRSLSSPQQYGIWDVEGVGLVVAFRGTASQEDVLVDINITPVPLEGSFPRGQVPIMVHRGFYAGATAHAEDILKLVADFQSTARSRRMPVWVTGHSLGGGYANCMLLHLLAQRRGAQLFSAGGGAMTFGAPQVVYAEDAPALYDALTLLESRGWSSRHARRPADAQIFFHNFVNNADVVPRLLGKSLDSVHEQMEYYIPSMRSVRETARHYHPFGAYHYILGSSVRTPKPEHTAPEGVAGHMGNAAYADLIRRHLDISALWKAVYATMARGGGATHHSLTSYRARLKAHAQEVAARMPTGAPSSSASASSFFAPRPGLGEGPPRRSSGAGGGARGGQQAPGAPSQQALEEVAELVGQAGSLLLSHAATSGYAAAGSLRSSAAARWQAYWNAPRPSPGPTEQEPQSPPSFAQTRAAARSQARQEDTDNNLPPVTDTEMRDTQQSWAEYLTRGWWTKGRSEEL